MLFAMAFALSSFVCIIQVLPLFAARNLKKSLYQLGEVLKKAINFFLSLSQFTNPIIQGWVPSLFVSSRVKITGCSNPSSIIMLEPHMSERQNVHILQFLCGKKSYWNCAKTSLVQFTGFYPMCLLVIKVHFDDTSHWYPLDQLVAHWRKRRIMINLHLHSRCSRQNHLVTLFM